MQSRSFQAPGPVGDRAGRVSVSALAALRGSKEQASSESLAGRILTRPLGNRGTGAALGLLQHQGAVSKGSAPGGHKPELPASQPGDPAEREAEVMAEQVMRAPTGKNGYQAQRNLSTATSGSGGRHLDSGVRRFMEPKFNYDFSQVRIHTDSASMQSADDLNARAYTIGKDIYFGRGEYQPETADGQQLLAHELTHVIQQSGGARAPGIHAQASPMMQRAVRFTSKTPLAIDHWTDGASSVTADESTVTTGDYKATAEAHVEADTAAELANWEVGFLQNDRITWERNYYTRSNADGRGKFLESKLVVPSAPLRDHEDDTIVWAASGEFADVAAAAGGATSVDIPLESTDEPESPRTNHGSDVGDATDGRDNIFERRIGDNFISFVSAHNSVTDEWRHLELIYWSGQASVDFAPTVGGAPSITKDERVLGQSRRFRWTTAADQPAIGGTLANDYVGDAANTKISRVNGWT